MALRYYANAPATTLTTSCSSVATSIVVASTAGLPISYPYTLILDRGTATEEAVSVTAAGGTTLTVTRGIDTTTAYAHAIGATVVHGITAQDVREPNTHVNSINGVHGVTGDVVGRTDTQTLTNKTVNLSSNTLSGTKAQFNTALSDADFVTSTDASMSGWISYTPTLQGGYTVGSGGSTEGWYVVIGKTCYVKMRWVLGTGFTIGNGVGFNLPVTREVSHSPGGITPGQQCRLGSNGVNVWYGGSSIVAQNLTAYVIGTNGVATAISSTVPFTWKATDSIEMACIYEVA